MQMTSVTYRTAIAQCKWRPSRIGRRDDNPDDVRHVSDDDLIIQITSSSVPMTIRLFEWPGIFVGRCPGYRLRAGAGGACRAESCREGKQRPEGRRVFIF